MIRLGIPSGVTQAIMSMSMIVVQSLTNSFGEQFIASNVILMRVDGFAMMPMWISIFQTVILRVPLAYLMCYLSRSEEYPQGRQELIIVSMLISWVVGMLLTCFFYARGKWKTKALGQAQEAVQD